MNGRNRELEVTDRRVALLRGINVGRAKRIAMADLRALLTELGYGEVRTLLNSGNVVFTGEGRAAEDAARIEAAVGSRLGVSSRVTVVTSAELAATVAENPLLDIATDPSRLLVAFPAEAGDVGRLEELRKESWAPEALALGTRVAYLWCPEGLLAGRLASAMGSLLRDAVTTRNWSTVLKLQALVTGVK